MLLKELLQLNESASVTKTKSGGISVYKVPDDLLTQNESKLANDAAIKDGFLNVYDVDAKAHKLLSPTVYRMFTDFDEAVSWAKKTSSAEDPYAVVDFSYKVAGRGQRQSKYYAIPLKTSPKVVSKIGNLDIKNVDDDRFWEFINDEDSVKTAYDLFKGNHGIFYTPHPALKMHPDWEQSGKEVKFVKDVMANPDKYCVIRPYTGSNANDHWDDIVIVKRDGLKHVVEDLNNQFVDNKDDARDVVDRVNAKLDKHNITPRMTVREYMNFENAPYSKIKKSGAGFMVISVEND